MNEELSNKIQERIDAGKITPLPRWRFFLLRFTFWFLAGLSIVVGSFAVGTTLFLFFDYHRHGLLAIPHETTELLSMVPFLWIIILALFTIIAETSIKHTKQGYRYSLRAVVLVSVLLSIILGSIFNIVGLGRTTHEFFSQVPFYSSVTYDAHDAWSRPVIGRLAGVVSVIRDSNNFSILDFNGRIWRVHLGTSTRGSFHLEASSTVRMSGMEESSSSAFTANSIQEWEQ